MALLDAAADFLDVKDFFIAIGGNAGEGAFMSKKINRTSLALPMTYSYNEYDAPVAEIIYIGDNDNNESDLGLPSSFIPGDTLEVLIQDTSNNFIPAKKIERYSYATKLTDTSSTAIDGIVAAINAGSLMTAVAIGKGTANEGIKLTGKTPGVRYKVSFGGLMVDSPIFTAYNAAGNALSTNLPVAPTAGSGTYAQVKAAVDYSSALDGNTSRNYLAGDLYSAPVALQPVVGETYSIFTFNYSLDGFYPSSTRRSVPQTLQVCVPSGASTLITKLDALFDEAVNPTASGSTESGENEEDENA
jgi:hypothetical protein